MSLQYIFTRISALLGNKDDISRIGAYYYLGKHVPKDYDKALKYLRKAVNKRCKKALYYLGLMHKNGEGVEQDYALAIRYLELARVEKNEAKEVIDSIEQELFSKERAENIAPTLFKIGYMYANDNAVGKDYEKALTYYKRASSYGHNSAKNQLGQIYAYGRLGVEPNYHTATTYLFSALRAGFNPVKNTLYKLYENQDYFDILKESVDESADAQDIYGLMYLNGVIVYEDRDKAIEYFEKAAATEHPDALFNLAMIYQEKNPEKTNQYYQRAKELGHIADLSVLSEKSKAKES